jgi:hypothetical protein
MLPIVMIRPPAPKCGIALDRRENRTHVDRQHPIERLERKRLDRTGIGYGGVVDKDVEATEVRNRLVNRRDHLLCVRIVRHDRRRPVRRCPTAVCRPAVRRGVSEGHLDAVRGQPLDDRRADSS